MRVPTFLGDVTDTSATITSCFQRSSAQAQVRAVLVVDHVELLMGHMIPKMHLETAVVNDTNKYTLIRIMQTRTLPKRGAQHMIPKMQLAKAVLSKIQMNTPR